MFESRGGPRFSLSLNTRSTVARRTTCGTKTLREHESVAVYGKRDRRLDDLLLGRERLRCRSHIQLKGIDLWEPTSTGTTAATLGTAVVTIRIGSRQAT